MVRSVCPSSSSRLRYAALPECFPSTRLLASRPTEAGVMIS